MEYRRNGRVKEDEVERKVKKGKQEENNRRMRMRRKEEK
jgi:hypothetical protein